MRFEWDDQKNAINRIKHGVRFETAAAAFDDPWFLIEQDYVPGEARWRTIGEVNGRVLLVVHLLGECDNDETNEEMVRIISAREASPQERRRYERGL